MGSEIGAFVGGFLSGMMLMGIFIFIAIKLIEHFRMAYQLGASDERNSILYGTEPTEKRVQEEETEEEVMDEDYNPWRVR